MNVLTAILGFLAKIIASVIGQMLTTPARKEKVDVQEGDAEPLDDGDFDGLYGSARVRGGGKE